MAYNGYLIKVGGYTVPLDMIYADSYKCVRTVIDLDAYRDANGELHRNALDHVPYKIEFKLKPMYQYQMNAVFHNGIRNALSNKLERKAYVTFYDFETDSYISQYMYMPDVNFQVYGIFNNLIQYDETTIKFIGY